MDKRRVQNSLKIGSVRAEKEMYIDLYILITTVTKTAPLSTWGMYFKLDSIAMTSVSRKTLKQFSATMKWSANTTLIW